jgi:hypothetical protein
MKHHPSKLGALTQACHPGWEHWQPVSFTGAVSSQRVTEEYEGWLSLVGNQVFEYMDISQPNCETYKSSRCESRSK